MPRISKRISIVSIVFLALVLLSHAPMTCYAQVTPVLTEISPDATTPQVTAVFIKGKDLQQIGYTTTVTFNGVPVPPEDMLSITPEQVVVLVPTVATSGPVIVSANGANSNPLLFEVLSSDYVPGEVIAKLTPGASIGRVLAETDLKLLSIIPLGETTRYRFGIPDGRTIAEAIRALFQTGLVEDASSNFIYEEFALPSRQNQTPPNDPAFLKNTVGHQYGPQRIRVVDGKESTPDAHQLSRGSGVTIAIVDTGIDYTHEDLAAKVIKGKNFTVPPSDPRRDDPIDNASHGTHVAGIAAAITNNGKGIAGIAPDSKLLAVKVLADKAPSSSVSDGIKFAIRSKAQVINLSLGSQEKDWLAEVVSEAVGRKITVVAASGNGGRLSGTDTKCYPAAISDPVVSDGIIAVGNSMFDDNIVRGTRNPDGTHPTDGNKCKFFGGGSSRGKHLDITAPGHQICSTVPSLTPGGPNVCTTDVPADRYRQKSGTSMAAPHVSGVAALMLERDPNLSPSQIECLMRITAVDLGDPGKDIAFGDGRVDAYAAVLAVTSLNKRYELLPRGCNSWKPSGGKKIKPGGGGGVVPDPPIPPGTVPGSGHYDQVLPITADSGSAFMATVDGKTVRVNLATSTVTSFAGTPVSDVALTPDDKYALVSEFAGVDVDGELRRMSLATNTSEKLTIKPPVTEITITPDSKKALVGTVENLSVVDLLSYTQANLKEFDVEVITGISVAPDSLFALVGEPEGVAIVNLASFAITRLTTGIPITGIPITKDGVRGIVGVPGGVTIIAIPTATPTALVSGTPVSNIVLTPDNKKAVYATLTGLVIVDLAAGTFKVVVTPAPVTDVDITADSVKAVVGTKAGVSIVDIATAVVTNVILPTPLYTGISLSPDNKWATVGLSGGIAVIDLAAGSAVTVPTSGPVTNVSVTPNSLKGVVGTLTGCSVIDLPAKTATAIAMSRPVIAPTITPDSLKAVVGTITGLSVIDIVTNTAAEVSKTAPVLNIIPNNGQPPLNPTGERGNAGSSDG